MAKGQERGGSQPRTFRAHAPQLPPRGYDRLRSTYVPSPSVVLAPPPPPPIPPRLRGVAQLHRGVRPRCAILGHRRHALPDRRARRNAAWARRRRRLPPQLALAPRPADPRALALPQQQRPWALAPGHALLAPREPLPRVHRPPRQR